MPIFINNFMVKAKTVYKLVRVLKYLFMVPVCSVQCSIVQEKGSIDGVLEAPVNGC